MAAGLGPAGALLPPGYEARGGGGHPGVLPMPGTPVAQPGIGRATGGSGLVVRLPGSVAKAALSSPPPFASPSASSSHPGLAAVTPSATPSKSAPASAKSRPKGRDGRGSGSRRSNANSQPRETSAQARARRQQDRERRQGEKFVPDQQTNRYLVRADRITKQLQRCRERDNALKRSSLTRFSDAMDLPDHRALLLSFEAWRKDEADRAAAAATAPTPRHGVGEDGEDDGLGPPGGDAGDAFAGRGGGASGATAASSSSSSSAAAAAAAAGGAGASANGHGQGALFHGALGGGAGAGHGGTAAGAGAGSATQSGAILALAAAAASLEASGEAAAAEPQAAASDAAPPPASVASVTLGWGAGHAVAQEVASHSKRGAGSHASSGRGAAKAAPRPGKSWAGEGVVEADGATLAAEEDWARLGALAEGPTCPACGFEKEAADERCWNTDCALCPIAGEEHSPPSTPATAPAPALEATDRRRARGGRAPRVPASLAADPLASAAALSQARSAFPTDCALGVDELAPGAEHLAALDAVAAAATAGNLDAQLDPPTAVPSLDGPVVVPARHLRTRDAADAATAIAQGPVAASLRIGLLFDSEAARRFVGQTSADGRRLRRARRRRQRALRPNSLLEGVRPVELEGAGECDDASAVQPAVPPTWGDEPVVRDHLGLLWGECQDVIDAAASETGADSLDPRLLKRAASGSHEAPPFSPRPGNASSTGGAAGAEHESGTSVLGRLLPWWRSSLGPTRRRCRAGETAWGSDARALEEEDEAEEVVGPLRRSNAADLAAPPGTAVDPQAASDAAEAIGGMALLPAQPMQGVGVGVVSAVNDSSDACLPTSAGSLEEALPSSVCRGGRAAPKHDEGAAAASVRDRHSFDDAERKRWPLHARLLTAGELMALDTALADVFGREYDFALCHSFGQPGRRLAPEERASAAATLSQRLAPARRPLRTIGSGCARIAASSGSVAAALGEAERRRGPLPVTYHAVRRHVLAIARMEITKQYARHRAAVEDALAAGTTPPTPAYRPAQRAAPLRRSMPRIPLAPVDPRTSPDCRIRRSRSASTVADEEASEALAHLSETAHAGSPAPPSGRSLAAAAAAAAASAQAASAPQPEGSESDVVAAAAALFSASAAAAAPEPAASDAVLRRRQSAPSDEEVDRYAPPPDFRALEAAVFGPGGERVGQAVALRQLLRAAGIRVSAAPLAADELLPDEDDDAFTAARVSAAEAQAGSACLQGGSSSAASAAADDSGADPTSTAVRPGAEGRSGLEPFPLLPGHLLQFLHPTRSQLAAVGSGTGAIRSALMHASPATLPAYVPEAFPAMGRPRPWGDGIPAVGTAPHGPLSHAALCPPSGVAVNASPSSGFVNPGLWHQEPTASPRGPPAVAGLALTAPASPIVALTTAAAGGSNGAGGPRANAPAASPSPVPQSGLAPRTLASGLEPSVRAALAASLGASGPAMLHDAASAAPVRVAAAMAWVPGRGGILAPSVPGVPVTWIRAFTPLDGTRGRAVASATHAALFAPRGAGARASAARLGLLPAGGSAASSAAGNDSDCEGDASADAAGQASAQPLQARLASLAASAAASGATVARRASAPGTVVPPEIAGAALSRPTPGAWSAGHSHAAPPMAVTTPTELDVGPAAGNAMAALTVAAPAHILGRAFRPRDDVNQMARGVLDIPAHLRPAGAPAADALASWAESMHGPSTPRLAELARQSAQPAMLGAMAELAGGLDALRRSAQGIGGGLPGFPTPGVMHAGAAGRDPEAAVEGAAWRSRSWRLAPEEQDHPVLAAAAGLMSFSSTELTPTGLERLVLDRTEFIARAERRAMGLAQRRRRRAKRARAQARAAANSAAKRARGATASDAASAASATGAPAAGAGAGSEDAQQQQQQQQQGQADGDEAPGADVERENPEGSIARGCGGGGDDNAAGGSVDRDQGEDEDDEDDDPLIPLSEDEADDEDAESSASASGAATTAEAAAPAAPDGPGGAPRAKRPRREIRDPEVGVRPGWYVCEDNETWFLPGNGFRYQTVHTAPEYRVRTAAYGEESDGAGDSDAASPDSPVPDAAFGAAGEPTAFPPELEPELQRCQDNHVAAQDCMQARLAAVLHRASQLPHPQQQRIQLVLMRHQASLHAQRLGAARMQASERAAAAASAAASACTDVDRDRAAQAEALARQQEGELSSEEQRNLAMAEHAAQSEHMAVSAPLDHDTAACVQAFIHDANVESVASRDLANLHHHVQLMQLGVHVGMAAQQHHHHPLHHHHHLHHPGAHSLPMQQQHLQHGALSVQTSHYDVQGHVAGQAWQGGHVQLAAPEHSVAMAAAGDEPSAPVVTMQLQHHLPHSAGVSHHYAAPPATAALPGSVPAVAPPSTLAMGPPRGRSASAATDASTPSTDSPQGVVQLRQAAAPRGPP
ncbi:hypothetical protein FNF27_05588 [Cafeteria roenbergensis]|uniref:Uncharacterized protein n=2 Tax=Cafeteria roenbergensis TaxID=33653 RepID=A0A5A8EAL3_CAFRO|nr:hypothetical protein FNF27_05588 [Cafeteria roenbergensis]